MSTIPKRLRDARLAARRSAQSVGDAIGLSQSTISAVENGTREVKLADLEAWASELGMRIELVQQEGAALAPRRAAVVALMAEVLQGASEEDVDVWESELRIRRRRLVARADK
jgi:transcriptional regulator with XRE-family HTH domain